MKIFRTKSKIANFWLDVACITAIFACICFIFFWPIRVEGNSMSPTINMGDQLIVSRFLAFFDNYSHGDLVMINLEIDGNSTTAIKRVAAVPGDHLVITGYALYINNIRQEWPFLAGNDVYIDMVLGSDQYFLLGDNTTISNDSRHFGSVTNRQIIAKIILRYFPLSVIEIF